MGVRRRAVEGLGVSLPDPAFWRGRRVLVTGHTGFKGGWAGLWLREMGAEATGFALPPDTDPSLFAMLGDAAGASLLGDLRDAGAVADAVAGAAPELVLHMAAQPLVRRGYADPVATFASNVMGTVHLLEALRGVEGLRAILVVTTDKVYENDESGRPFGEADRLGGHDPYAASKAATEIAVASYARSFFAPAGVRLATARGGNVIGGGDFAADRLIPDIVRAGLAGAPVRLRNPRATRPWQHVLDCVAAYLAYLEALAQGRDVPPSLNVGPPPGEVLTVAEIADAISAALDLPEGWAEEPGGPHEMKALSLDPGLAAAALGWRGRLAPSQAIRLTADWYAAWRRGADMEATTRAQIRDYMEAQP